MNKIISRVQYTSNKDMKEELYKGILNELRKINIPIQEDNGMINGVKCKILSSELIIMTLYEYDELKIIKENKK